MADLRVLLISPVRGVDPLSGDVTYTEQLLAAPPPGVVYTTYPDAIAAGTLVECGSRGAVRTALAADRPRQLAIAGWRKAESLVRRTGLVFREPLRIFEVTPGAFDVVHAHVFHTRFLGEHPPVVMSAGGPLRWLYASAWSWSSARCLTAEAFDRIVGTAWDASVFGVRPGRASRIVTLSEDFKLWLVARGWDPGRIAVAPNYLATNGIARRPRGSDEAAARFPRTLGFVAKDFDAKGGAIALAAFDELRARHAEIELLIVGSPPRQSAAELAGRGVTWLPVVSRAELLNEVLPRIDILMYPSHSDTSVPYGPMEALSAGIPCVVSDHGSLPDLVGEDAGRVSRVGDAASLVAGVEGLLDPAAWSRASDAAHARFHNRFSAETQAPRLGDAYRAALSGEEEEHPVTPYVPPTTVSVVIATYNRPDHVRTCLEHLALQTVRPVETVVVDASPDARTAEVVRAHPAVTYVRNERGLGHTATSRAVGMASTTGAVVAFIDDDAYAEPEWLAELLRRYVDERVGAVGGRARNGLPGEETDGLDEVGLLLADGRLTGNFAAITSGDVEVDHLLGANMSVRRDVVEALGGIHDHFPGTCLREETDIVLRMRESGYRILYTPDAVVRHVGGTYAKGHRFDLRYQFFGARNHIVLLTHTLGFRDPHLRRYLRLAAGAIAQDMAQGVRAWSDPTRSTPRARLRGAVGGLARAAAQIAGLSVGLAAAFAIRVAERRRPVGVAPSGGSGRGR